VARFLHPPAASAFSPVLIFKTLLDRDRLVEIGVAGEIGDAEPALSQHAFDRVPVQAVL